MRGDDAVSEVLGYVLIAVIVMISLSWLVAFAVPMLDETRGDTAFLKGLNDLGKLQSNMETVARGPIGGAGSSRVTTIDLGEGSLTVKNGTGKIGVEFDTATAGLTGIVNATVVTLGVVDPVSGVEVSLVGTSYIDATDSDGLYSITAPTEETYEVRAARRGFSARTKTITLNSGDSLDFGLVASNGSLSVRVENTSEPVDGVEVSINGTPYSYEATGNGDERYGDSNSTVDGVANFSGVPTGENYTVSLERDFYVDEELKRVSVRENDTTKLNFTLTEAGMVDVTVKNATGPLPNATVTVYNRSEPSVKTNATNGTGDTRFYKVPAHTGGRTYTVVAFADGYEPNATSVDVDFGSTASTSLKLEPSPETWELNGTVHDSLNASYGMSNAWVNYTYNSTEVVVGTGESGGYELPVVNGTYEFTADAPDYVRSTPELSVTENSTHDFPLEIEKIGHLHGYVKNSTGNLSDAQVTVRGETVAGWRLTGSDTSGAEGYYNVTRVETSSGTLEGIPPGKHSVEVSRPGYETKHLRFELSSNDTLLNVTLEKRSQVALNGTVKNPLGESIEGANVTVLDTSYADVTDDDGFYSTAVPRGTYDIKASKGGYLPSYSYDTPLEGDTTLNFSLEVAIKPGYLKYELDDREAWMESDLLARGSGTASADLRNNFVRVIDAGSSHTVSITVVSIEGGPYSQGGGVAHVETSFAGFEEVYDRDCGNFTVTVESPVHGAWENLFSEALRDAGLREGTGFTVKGPGETGEEDTVEVFVEGDGTEGNDIDLRFQRTRLKVEVR